MVYDNLSKKMEMPCPNCGARTLLKSDAEIAFCTSCGGKIELGIHSYREGESSGPKIFCVNCNLLLDQHVPGSIFSCNNCGEIVCTVCSKVVDFKHHCPNCYSSITPERAKTQPKKKGNKRSKKVSRKRTRKGAGKGLPKSHKKNQKKSSNKKNNAIIPESLIILLINF
jgi:predicted RNA-binding Zn-ribbon protein involved in translation (DUF1610 family)